MPETRFTPQDQRVLKEIQRLRRDIRGNRFTSEPISQDDLNSILTAAEMAPSVGFSQPWEFVLIKSQLIKQQVARIFDEENTRASNAFKDSKKQAYAQLKLEGILESSVNLAVYYTPEETPVLGQNSMPEMGEYSVVCAIQNMWLTARALNIGMGWVSIIDPNKINRLLKAPTESKLVAYLCLGHVKDFPESPELETYGWGKKKPVRLHLFEDGFPTDAPDQAERTIAQPHPEYAGHDDA